MLPRPLHRWTSFWLGVFVVVFLGWAWARSLDQWDILDWAVSKEEFYSLVNLEQKLRIVCNRTETSGATFRFQSIEATEEAVPVPPWIETTSSVFGWQIDVAHWFLILLFLLPWTTWLVGRSRRMKRLAPGSAGPQTGSHGP